MRPTKVAFLLAIVTLLVSWAYVWRLASIGGLGHRPGFANDFFQMWNVGKALMNGLDPYGETVTNQNQIAAFGSLSTVPGDQIFVYPLPAAFPFLPLALVSFPVADRLVFAALLLLIVFSVYWIRGVCDRTTALYALLALAASPVAVAVIMRQPSVLFFGFSVAALAALRADRILTSALLTSLAINKPQVGLLALLPSVTWCLTDRKRGRSFLVYFAVFSVLQLGGALIVRPDWVHGLISATKLYLYQFRQYHNHEPLVTSAFGQNAGRIVAIVIFVTLVILLAATRRRETMFHASLTAVALYLIGPFVTYNAILLIVPAIWTADNRQGIRQRGGAGQIGMAFVNLALVGLWLAPVVGLAFLHFDDHSFIGWNISGSMIVPLLLSLSTLMVINCLRHPVRTEELPQSGLGSADLGIPD